MGEEESLLLLRDKEETRDQQRSGNTVTTVNDLPESLLLWEIFRRLHNPRDLLRCKSVCKHWNSLVSLPEFSYDPGFALIVNIPAPDQQRGEPHYATEEETFTDLRGFKLKYLPCFNRKYKHPVCIQTSCKDLLLCTRSYKAQRVFYIVNPFTAQWTRLPETPPQRSDLTLPVGLAVKLFRSNNSIRSRYKVVRITCIHSTWFRAEIFDSKICGWTVKFIGHPRRWHPTHNQGIVKHGVLHWLAKNGAIIAYNPFDPNQNRCRVIPRHLHMYRQRYKTDTIIECLTMSQGYLVVLQIIIFPTHGIAANKANHLCVWLLKDYKESIWKLHSRIAFQKMTSATPWIRDYMQEFFQRHTQYKTANVEKSHASFHTFNIEYPENRESVHRPEPLACHPKNINLVYLHLPHTIVSCDLNTGRLKIISEMSTQLESYYYDTVVPITLQLNPTPVPSFATETLLNRSNVDETELDFRDCPPSREEIGMI